MIGVIIAVVILMCVGAVAPMLSSKNTYGTRLDDYITRHNPVDASDVDRLTKQFQEREHRTFL